MKNKFSEKDIKRMSKGKFVTRFWPLFVCLGFFLTFAGIIFIILTFIDEEINYTYLYLHGNNLPLHRHLPGRTCRVRPDSGGEQRCGQLPQFVRRIKGGKVQNHARHRQHRRVHRSSSQ